MHGVIVAAVAASAVAWSTRFQAPPRFDGAGYAVLGQALLTGHGYREIDRPDEPPHAHYPPGYPAALAALWAATGRSEAAAHALSLACTVGAVVAAWVWFRRMYPPRAALGLALALALNWTWVRAGGEIQSEPLYFLGAQSALLVAAWAVSTEARGSGVILGVVLAACILCRHVGVALCVAVGIELLLRRRPRTAVVSAVVALALVAPWAVCLARVQHNTQVGLLIRGSLGDRLAGNAMFYLRRLPDALTGPFIEVATVFRGSAAVRVAATVCAGLATGMMLLGWILMLRSPRRRLAALVPLCTLALLLVWPFTEAGRFLIPLVPFLLLGAVEGAARIASRAGLARPRRWAIAAVLLAALPYTAYSLFSDRAKAQQQSHAGFDAACAWIVQNGSRPGPVLTRQPGEVFWLTGRQAVLPPGDDLGEIDQVIEHYGVAYLLVEDERYANAPLNPLRQYVASRPERVERVWEQGGERPVSLYAVVPRAHQRATGPSNSKRP